jgi:hypothetical protein
VSSAHEKLERGISKVALDAFVEDTHTAADDDVRSSHNEIISHEKRLLQRV